MDLTHYSPDSQRIKAIVEHPGTLATVLHSIAYRALGTELYSFEPETVQLELNEELGCAIPPGNFNKLMAIVSSVATDMFYRDWVTFLSFIKILNGDDDIEVGEPPSAPELAWAVAEVRLNDDGPANWSTDVARVAGVVLEEEGFVTPPKVLGFADFAERYEGSMYPADLSQQEVRNTEHAAVVEEYLELQSLLLFKQLSYLPWVTQDDLDKLRTEIAL